MIIMSKIIFYLLLNRTNILMKHEDSCFVMCIEIIKYSCNLKMRRTNNQTENDIIRVFFEGKKNEREESESEKEIEREMNNNLNKNFVFARKIKNKIYFYLKHKCLLI